MIELARHIEYLLLENDCVIIPDFGGFIAHNQPSYYDEVEHVFMPPIRTIGFNPQLSMNDGLLVQSYMQAYHTDYSDAIRIISGKVKELKEKNSLTFRQAVLFADRFQITPQAFKI